MKNITLISILLLITSSLFSQNVEVNYDESKIKPFILPDPLIDNSGKIIKNKKQWEKKRAPEILEIFKNQMFGIMPDQELKVSFIQAKAPKEILDGKADMQEIIMRISNTDSDNYKDVSILIILPKHTKGKTPIFMGYNFKGNHTVIDDEYISITNPLGNLNPKAPSFKRGESASRLPIELLIDNGYGIITACYQEICPDKKNGRDNSILSLYGDYDTFKENNNSAQAIA